MRITSRKNPLVMKYRQAQAGKLATWFVVEGPRLLVEALRANVALDSVLVEEGTPRDAELSALLHERGLTVVEVTRSVLEVATDAVSPQGTVALAQVPAWSVEDVFGSAETPLLLVAAGVQNPGNLGSLVRSAEAFGADGVIALAGSAQPFRPAVVRGAMGSTFRMPTLHGWSNDQLCEQLARRHVTSIALVPRDGEPLDEASLAGPIALVVGSEAHGIDASLVERCTRLVSIPQSATVESLSVSNAAAIALYELMRRRRERARR